MSTPGDIVDTGPDRRVAPAQIALAVLVAFLLLVLLWFFFLRSDDPEVDAGATAPPAVEEVEEPEEEEPAAPPKNSPVETFEVFAPKDPFDPLISASAAGGGAAGSASTTTGGAVGTTSAGATDGTGTAGTTTTTTTPGGGGDGGTDVAGHRVRVVDVFTQGGRARAQVQVDGTVYTVDEGERFAENFQLMSTSGRCASMLYGDDEFTLCEGEEILK